MNLLKSSFYSSISTGISFISGFVLIKVVSSQIGPSGIAIVGQFQNTIALFALFGTLAINNGVVRAVAQYAEDREKVQQIFNNALLVTLACSLLISLVIALMSHSLAASSLHNEDLWIVFFCYSIFFSLTGINSIISNVYNGLHEIKKLTFVNIASSLIGVSFTIGFSLKWKLTGVLLAVNAAPLSLFIINIGVLRKLGLRLFPNRLFGAVDHTILKGFLAFTLMNLVSGIVAPITQLLVRNKIISDYSAQEAGYWQGVTKISDYYLQFITTVLGIYYLPKLASLKTDAEIKLEVRNGYKIILPVVGVLAIGIWLCAKWIILILFSKEFLPMQPFFSFQLLGDFFKMASWLPGYLMIAKSMTRLYILTEVVFSTTFVLLSWFFIQYYGAIGATYAFCLNFFAYMLFMSIKFRKIVF